MNKDFPSSQRKNPKKKSKARNSSVSNQKSGVYGPNINLHREYNEWNNTFDRLVNMMSIIVPKPNIPLNCQANKRFFLEEMCAAVCQKANNLVSPKKNSSSNKIKKYQIIIRNLSKRVKELEAQNQINQVKYEEQLNLQKESQIENSALEDKINRVEEILIDHIQKKPKTAKQKLKERPTFVNSFNKDESKTEINMSDDFFPASFSIQNDFDQKTTKAITRYRQRVRKQEESKGKVRNVFPFQYQKNRNSTNQNPLSQDAINDALMKLPHQTSERGRSFTQNRSDLPFKW